MPFTVQELEVAAKQRQEAIGFVKAQGLLVAETHDNPHSRGLIGNLINAGLVDHLFLEVQDPTCRDALEVDVDGHLGAWLRKHAQARTDLRQLREWKTFCEGMAFGLFWAEQKNPVKSTRLIEFAVAHGVGVWLADMSDEQLHGVSSISPKGMQTRNAYIVGKVREVVPQGSLARCVLLVGSDHAPGLKSLGMGTVAPIKAQK